MVPGADAKESHREVKAAVPTRARIAGHIDDALKLLLEAVHVRAEGSDPVCCESILDKR
jgi:hypothetical protein